MYKEWPIREKAGAREKEKSTNYRNYVQHGFQTHTHPDGLIDEPNESPKKSKGGNKGRHKGLEVELCGGGGGGRTI